MMTSLTIPVLSAEDQGQTDTMTTSSNAQNVTAKELYNDELSDPASKTKSERKQDGL